MLQSRNLLRLNEAAKKNQCIDRRREVEKEEEKKKKKKKKAHR
jgi:hypothetical protein